MVLKLGAGLPSGMVAGLCSFGGPCGCCGVPHGIAGQRWSMQCRAPAISCGGPGDDVRHRLSMMLVLGAEDVGTVISCLPMLLACTVETSQVLLSCQCSPSTMR